MRLLVLLITLLLIGCTNIFDFIHNNNHKEESKTTVIQVDSSGFEFFKSVREWQLKEIE